MIPGDGDPAGCWDLETAASLSAEPTGKIMSLLLPRNSGIIQLEVTVPDRAPLSDNTMKTNRRDFLKAVSVSLAGAPFMLGRVGLSNGPYQVLMDAEAETLIALCEQLIPEDEYGGATEAGVVYFFDKQLSERGQYPDQFAFYRKEIASLNSSCQTLHQSGFASLNPDEQLAFLKKMEMGKIADAQWKTAKQRQFFKTLLDHTMQGFYGASRHGGNKNNLSHTMIGI